MIIGNQKKLYYKKKSWLTPKHPLYFESEEFKMYYAAAVMIHAAMNPQVPPEQNYELDRLIHRGLELRAEQMALALKKSANPSEVLGYLCDHMDSDEKRYLLMLDLYNISSEDDPSEKEQENIRLVMHMLEIPEKASRLLAHFIQAAGQEKDEQCRRIYQQMTEAKMELSLMELKYYRMTLYETSLCTQEDLDKAGKLRLVDRCEIREDLVLRDGMVLRLDHAV